MTEAMIVEPEVKSAGQWDAGQFFNDDGTFVENWHQNLPDDLKGEKSIQTFKTLPDVIKSYVNTKKLMGDKRIAIPSENAKPEEVAEFYKAIGRPEKPDEYKFSVPDELKDYYDDEILNQARSELHKIGLTKSQFDVVMALDKQRLADGIKKMAEAEQNEIVEAEHYLRAKWGDKYDARLNLANRMISENADLDIKDKLIGEIGNNPVVADFLANIASKFLEHKEVIAQDMTASYDIQQKIDELMHTDAYRDGTHQDHKLMVERVQKLFQQKAGK
jgi:hypothetical protein